MSCEVNKENTSGLYEHCFRCLLGLLCLEIQCGWDKVAWKDFRHIYFETKGVCQLGSNSICWL